MKKGIFYCIGAAILFGVAPSILKFLLLQGMSELCCVLCTNSFLFLASLGICLKKKISLKIKPSMAVKLALMGIMGMGVTTVLIAASYSYISVGTTLVVHFLYPTVVTIASVFLFKQKTTWSSVLALVLSISGMVCIAILGNESGGQFLGYVIAGLSSLTYAFYILGSELFQTKSVPMPVMLAYMAGGSSLMLLIATIVTGQVTLPSTPTVWIALVAFCIIGGTPHALLNIGISKVGPVDASFATLLEPVTAVLCGVVIYQEQVTMFSIIGFILIFAAVVLNTLGSKKV